MGKERGQSYAQADLLILALATTISTPPGGSTHAAKRIYPPPPLQDTTTLEVLRLSYRLHKAENGR